MPSSDSGDRPFPVPAEVNPVSLPLPHPEAYEGEPREYARALMQRKDQIEAEIDTLKDVLASHGATGSTSLFDPEGYPRGDIDVYAIRHARAALARLNTDRQQVNSLLATALEAAFAPGPSTSVGTRHTAVSNGKAEPKMNGHAPELAGEYLAGSEDVRATADVWPSRAVARVNMVAQGSPADAAGLKAGDLIHSFGDITADAPGDLQAIGALVGRSEGVIIHLRIVRNAADRLELDLTPRTGWGGRGSLGCHILPA